VEALLQCLANDLSAAPLLPSSVWHNVFRELLKNICDLNTKAMKTVTMTIGGMFITSVMALAQASPTTPVNTVTPATTTGANSTLNAGTNSSNNNGTTPLTQPAQTLQGMPQSQVSPAVAPAQPSPYQSPAQTQQAQMPAQSPSVQTQPAMQPVVPGSQIQTQPVLPATTGQSQMTQPGTQVQSVQPLPPMTTFPSIITTPVPAPQTGTQQQNQPPKQQ